MYRTVASLRPVVQPRSYPEEARVKLSLPLFHWLPRCRIFQLARHTPSTLGNSRCINGLESTSFRNNALVLAPHSLRPAFLIYLCRSSLPPFSLKSSRLVSSHTKQTRRSPYNPRPPNPSMPVPCTFRPAKEDEDEYLARLLYNAFRLNWYTALPHFRPPHTPSR